MPLTVQSAAIHSLHFTFMLDAIMGLSKKDYFVCRGHSEYGQPVWLIAQPYTARYMRRSRTWGCASEAAVFSSPAAASVFAESGTTTKGRENGQETA